MGTSLSVDESYCSGIVHQHSDMLILQLGCKTLQAKKGSPQLQKVDVLTTLSSSLSSDLLLRCLLMMHPTLLVSPHVMRGRELSTLVVRLGCY